MRKNLFLHFLLSLFLLFISLLSPRIPARAGDDSLETLHLLSDETLRFAQQMVEHGSEGHTSEIVLYGDRMLLKVSQWIQVVQASSSPEIKRQRKAFLVSLKAIQGFAQDAVRLGKENQGGLAVEAARQSVSRARQARRKVYALKEGK